MDDVYIGRLSEKIKEGLDLKLGNNDRCYLAEKKADEFARRWEDSYLAKISEAKKILRSPRYVAKDEERKELYFIRDYPLERGGISFAGVILSYRKQLSLSDIKCFKGEEITSLSWRRA